MKKLLLILTIIGTGIVVLLDQNPGWRSRIIPGSSPEAVTERQHYFEQLSETYYGSSLYWNELSIVNSKITNTENPELIIPSLESIKRLKNKQNLSLTDNSFSVHNEPIYLKPSQDKKEQKSSFEFIYYALCVVSILISSIRYTRRKTKIEM